MVRAGDRPDQIDALRTAGMIALAYEAVGDVRELSLQEIEQAIASARSPEPTAQLRSRLMRFAHDIRVGDLVVTPDRVDHLLWISTVTGAYDYVQDPPLPGSHHAHEVRWLGWVERSAPWLRHKLEYLDNPASVVELRDPDWWFAQVALLDLPTVRPLRRVAPPPEPARRASSSRGGTSRPATPRAPRPVTPKPPSAREVAARDAERVLCAGSCGLQWRPAVLVDGLCPDCR